MVAQFENINKTFCTSAGTYNVNEETSINLYRGEILSICGKSEYSNDSFLTLMGCLINPNEGILEINGKNVNLLRYEEMVLTKLQSISFVFHQHNLIDTINTEENVAFPLKSQNLTLGTIKQRTAETLKSVSLYDIRKKMPNQLSSFEKQLILIARALVTNPEIIVCDDSSLYILIVI